MHRSAPPPAGRNSPCPCGSGKKFKRCCLHRERDTGAVRSSPSGVPGGPPGTLPGGSFGAQNGEPPGAGQRRDGTGGANRGPAHAGPDAFADIHAAFDGKHFGTIEEASVFADALMKQRNDQRIDDFLGLTSADMHCLLHAPLVSPERVTVPDLLDVEPAAPVLRLFDRLCEAIGDSGLVATGKGNLPRAFCRETNAARLLPKAIDPLARMRDKLSSEEEFHELSALRHTAEFAGLIERRGRRFFQTDTLRAARERGGSRAVYPILLKAWAADYNWAAGDHEAEVFIVQQSWLFTLLLLQQGPRHAYPAGDVADRFITAFPAAIDEIQDAHEGPRERLRYLYSRRAVLRFAAFFGLVDAQLAEGEDELAAQSVRIEPTPLLHQVAHFKVGPAIRS